MLAARDWGEINIAINLVFDPLVAALFARELMLRFAPHHGDPVTPVLVEGAEGDRAQRAESTGAFVRFLLEQDAENRATIEAWLETWSPGALEACRALAPLFSLPENPPENFESSLERVVGEWRKQLEGLGLTPPGVNS